MKKLQILALLMLLSTSYSTQTVPGGQGGGQRPVQMSSEQLATALGGSVTYASISAYVESLSKNIAKLSASSTTDEKQAVRKQIMVMNQSLRQLDPKNNQQ